MRNEKKNKFKKSKIEMNFLHPIIYNIKFCSLIYSKNKINHLLKKAYLLQSLHIFLSQNYSLQSNTTKCYTEKIPQQTSQQICLKAPQG